MLTPRLTDCGIYANIPSTLVELNDRLVYWAKIEYSNIVFSLNQYIPGEIIQDLLHYKQILEYRLCNPDYAKACGAPTDEQITSRVKVLIHK